MDGEGYQAGSDNISTDVGERQRAGEEAVFTGLKLGKAWGESITKGRAAELEGMLQS